VIVAVQLLGIAALLAGDTEHTQVELPGDKAILGDVLLKLGERYGDRFSRLSANHQKRVVKLLAMRDTETLLYDSELSDGDALVLALAALGG
jgi:hypothetical protein